MGLFVLMMTMSTCREDFQLLAYKVHGFLVFTISYHVLCRWFDKEDSSLNLAHFHKHKKHHGAQRQRLASTSGSQEQGNRPPGIHHQWGLQVCVATVCQAKDEIQVVQPHVSHVCCQGAII